MTTTLCGLIPSVDFLAEVPDSIRDSFFEGVPHVTVKDKIFQPSNAFRHAAELIQTQQASESTNNANEILMIYSDGGPDHRVTYGSVQVSLICLFILLDLDMLVAARNAPGQSWVNLAERVMSILNLALQNCALSRERMEPNLERKMNNKKNIEEVRQAAKTTEGLKESLVDSMQSPDGHCESTVLCDVFKGQRCCYSPASIR